METAVRSDRKLEKSARGTDQRATASQPGNASESAVGVQFASVSLSKDGTEVSVFGEVRTEGEVGRVAVLWSGQAHDTFLAGDSAHGASSETSVSFSRRGIPANEERAGEVVVYDSFDAEVFRSPIELTRPETCEIISAAIVDDTLEIVVDLSLESSARPFRIFFDGTEFKCRARTIPPKVDDRLKSKLKVAAIVLSADVPDIAERFQLFYGENELTDREISSVYRASTEIDRSGTLFHCEDMRWATADVTFDYASVSSAELHDRGKRLGLNRTFLRASGARVKAAVYLECAALIDDQSELAIVGFCGEREVQRIPLVVKPRKVRDRPILSPLRPFDGFAVYDFEESGADRQEPWVVLASGLDYWPITGGGMARTLNLASHLRSRGFRVALLAEEGAQQNHLFVHRLRDYCDRLVLTPYEQRQHRAPAFNARLRDRAQLQLGQAISTVAAWLQPRAVVVNFAFNLAEVPDLPCPIIADTHDVQSLRAENASRGGGDLSDRRCAEEEEKALLSKADLVLGIAPEETRHLQGLLGEDKPVVTVSHSIVLCDLEKEEGSSNRIMFVGQEYDPNVRGLRNFLQTAWPRIIEENPNAELHVVGRVCRPFAGEEHLNVFFHGVVEDLLDVYRRCEIVINPSPYGTGVKIKSLEAMAYGRCLVTTEAGLGGIDEQCPVQPTHIEDFAEAVLALQREDARRAALAKESAAFIESHHRPEIVFRPVTELAEREAPVPIDQGAPRLSGCELDVTGDVVWLRAKADKPGACLTLTTKFGNRPHYEAVVFADDAGFINESFPLTIPCWDGHEHAVSVWLGNREVARTIFRLTSTKDVDKRPLFSSNLCLEGGADLHFYFLKGLPQSLGAVGQGGASLQELHEFFHGTRRAAVAAPAGPAPPSGLSSSVYPFQPSIWAPGRLAPGKLNRAVAVTREGRFLGRVSGAADHLLQERWIGAHTSDMRRSLPRIDSIRLSADKVTALSSGIWMPLDEEFDAVGWYGCHLLVHLLEGQHVAMVAEERLADEQRNILVWHRNGIVPGQQRDREVIFGPLKLSTTRTAEIVVLARNLLHDEQRLGLRAVSAAEMK